MARLELRLLGTFRATLDGAPITAFGYEKVRALLTYLAVENDRPHQRERLAGLLWPEHTERNARMNLSQALSYLRRALDDRAVKPSFLDATPQTLQFDPASDHWLDAVAFTQALDACAKHAHASLESCEECLERLEEAVALYQGPFLEGFSIPDSSAFDEWVLLHRERLHRLAQETLGRLAEACAARGEYERGLAHAWRQVELDPWREAAQRGLMRLLALSGQRGAALAQYEECRRLLAEELGVEPAEETTALYEEIVAGAISPPVGVTAPVHNLPVQTTPFVGREEELAEIVERLEDPACRLLTLVGPGGCGKTRLALQAAEQQLGRYPDGVWFVPLAAVNVPESIVPAVADAIGFSFYQAGELQRQLLDYLRAKTTLLVMDNYEHLLKSSDPTGSSRAGFVTQILRTAPGVKVLATSRARLNVGGEHRYQVAGMRYPVPEIAVQETDEAAQYCAVKLFTQGAQRARRGFELTRKNVDGVVRICRLVDGMPLAIRLAAPWVAIMSPKEIASQLKSSLDLLVTDRPDVPERQRSVWASLDHTWRLIPERERELMEALSVFRAGFTRDAAQQVSGASLRDLKALAERSLLQFSTARGRYETHELLRQYGGERLAANLKQEHEVRDRHSGYFCDALGRWGEAMKRRQRLASGAAFEADWANLRLAWEWAAEHGYAWRLDLAVDGMGYLFVVLGRSHDILQLYQKAIDGLTKNLRLSAVQTKRVLAKVHTRCCYIYHEYRDWDLHQSHLRQAERLLDDPALDGVDTRAEEAHLHKAMGVDAIPDWDAVRWHYQRALTLQRELGYEGEVATRLVNIAWTYAGQENPAEARRHYEEALRLSTIQGNELATLQSLYMLGGFLLQEPNIPDSKRLYRELVAKARAFGSMVFQVLGQQNLGLCAVLEGDYVKAETLLHGCRKLAWRGGDMIQLCTATRLLGEVAWFRDDADAAERWLTEALDLAQRDRVLEGIILSKRCLAYIACERGDFDRAEVLCEQSLPSIQEHDVFSSGVLKLALARVYLFRGDPTLAVFRFQESLQDLRPNISWGDTIRALEELSWVLAALNRNKDALRLMGFLAAERERIGFVLPPVDQPHRESALSLAREGLGAETFAAAWESGAALTLEEAVDSALAISA